VIRFMLDTNVCVDLLRGEAAGLFRRLRKMKVDEVALSSITLAELQYGVAKSSDPPRHEDLLAQFCAPLAIMPFDSSAAEIYGKVRTELERAGTPIGPLDTLIAAHALALDVTLVTSNEREFARVKGLRVANWLRA
jgi:tRNA(fMet)-specific endonuclease VapC